MTLDTSVDLSASLCVPLCRVLLAIGMPDWLSQLQADPELKCMGNGLKLLLAHFGTDSPRTRLLVDRNNVPACAWASRFDWPSKSEVIRLPIESTS